MRKLRLGGTGVSILATVLVSGCVGDGALDTPGIDDAVRAKAPGSLWTALEGGAELPFIVSLAPADGALQAVEIPDVAIQRLLWAGAKQDALADVAAELAVEATWDQLPLMAVRATTLEAAATLLAHDEVTAAFEIETYALTDAESFALIRQPSAQAGGFVGAGTSVAILDTGADYTRADLGACTSPGVPTGCRVAFAQDFAASDSNLDDNGHGTNVSGISAGVAPGANILALDVFTGGGAYSNHIIDAINWAVANKATYKIASMNLSLGGGSSSVPCTSDAMGIALGTARAAGIAPVVASGNNGYTNMLSSPACAPAAISVGAVYDGNVGGVAYSSCTDAATAADKITCFSNSASFLTLLAPGARVTAAGITMSGTSQAAPHVAGAIAVLAAAYPGESVDQLVARLTTTGTRITDARNAITKPRIDLYAAVGAPPIDVTAPTGTVSINGGATHTKAAAVTLTIAGVDDRAVTTMCVSNTAACTAWVAFATTRPWTLVAGDGAKTVYVFLKDAAGNVTAAASAPRASIILDATLPVGGVVAATPSDAAITLAWAGFTDAGSGIVAYRVVSLAGAVAPTTCAGTPIYQGPALGYRDPGKVNGATWAYRVCAVDAAGNLSVGAIVTGMARAETTPPTGSIVINGGAAITRSLTVTLTLAAADASGVSSMCIGEIATCTTFVPFATSKAYTLAAGDRVRPISVWYRDVHGNISAPVTASIILDATAPTAGIVVGVPTSRQVLLAWSGATDAMTGIVGYKLVALAGTTLPAAACTTGTVIYTGAMTSYVHTGLTNGTTWAYRVCALDAAGNTGAGATALARPVPEITPPTGTIVINGGAAVARVLALTLTLSATDASGVTSMCFSEATTCSAFVPYATTATLTLAAGDRVRTVSVWYRDAWGNVSTPVAASILLDTTAPLGATLGSGGRAGGVDLVWTVATDVGTGLAGYKLVGQAGTTAPATCAVGTVLYSGPANTFAHTLAKGTTWSYRVCASDVAGNVAAGSTRTQAAL